jgi:hypothetical protein
MRAALSDWRWRIQRRLGLTNFLVLLMLLAAGLLAAWLPKLNTENETLRTQLRNVPTVDQTRAPNPPLVQRVPVSTQVGEFVAAFPTMAQGADDLEAIFLSAERHGVRLNKGEYQLKQEAGAPLIALRATFPIKADYRHLKDFTSDVLKTLPHAAMEELRMARSDASNPVLDASVRFSLVYRRP